MIGQKKDDLKERIKKAWRDGDMMSLVTCGLESGLDLLGGLFSNAWDKPMLFAEFLERTGDLFDAFIIASCKKENLNFVGGKLFLSYDTAEKIDLAADFYFQDAEKNWVVKKQTGRLPITQLLDWDDEPELAELRKEKMLEYPIEPPEAK